MNLSILIPVYNFEINLLLQKLVDEIVKRSYHRFVEIILIDDCSSSELIKKNNESFIYSLNQNFIHYFPLNKNVGRSVIRDLLIKKAKGANILFLDADTLPDSHKFITNYLTIIQNKGNSFNVILGGLSYKQRIRDDEEYNFYYYMGKKIGEISSEVRSENPWKYVVTSNLLISANVLKQIPIDISFIGYGFEDTEWGIRLIKDFEITHINNTVSHLGLENKDNLLKKILESALNYNKLIKKHDNFLLNWKLRYYVDKASLLHLNILSLLLKLSIVCFKFSKSNKLSLIFFQIIKIFAFAKNKKRTHYGRIENTKKYINKLEC